MINAEPWVTRAHPGPRATPFPLTPEQRQRVEAAIRPAKTEARVLKRAEALLLMAEGVGSGDVAKLLGIHVRTVFKWKKRFRGADDVCEKLEDGPRSGRPVSLFPTPMPPASKRKHADRPRTSVSR
jgi:DNA-directed RNA polymerase specialized sigma24 family protein